MRGNPKLLLSAFACLSLTLSHAAWAEDPMRVLRIAECEGNGIQSGEAAALQSLITSYAAELKMFRIIDASGQELALHEEETAVLLGTEKNVAPLVADYVLSSRLDRISSLFILTIDVTKTSTGEKKSVSDTFTSQNDAILAVRGLMRNLFDKGDAAASAAEAARNLPMPQANPAPTYESRSGLARQWRTHVPEPLDESVARPRPSRAAGRGRSPFCVW